MGENTLPEPLVPPHVDLSNFSYVPIYAIKLRDSGFVAESTGDEFKAAVLLWCAAWHQIPAGSLPDNDMALRRFAGLSMSDWESVKKGAMRGFTKCSDGRLYHAVLAASANASWEEKVKRKQKVEAANKAKKEKALRGLIEDEARFGSRDEARDELRDDSRNETRDIRRDDFRDEQRNEVGNEIRDEERDDPRHAGKRREGKGRDVKEDNQKLHEPPPKTEPEPQTAQVGLIPDAAPSEPIRRRRPGQVLNGEHRLEEVTAGTKVFLAYSEAYERVYGIAPVRDAKTSSQCKTLADRLGAEEAPQIAGWYLSHRDPFYGKAAHSLDLLVRDYQRIRTDWHRRNLNGSGGTRPRGVQV